MSSNNPPRDQSFLPEGWMWIWLDECVDILDSKRVPINAKEREERTNGKHKSELYPYYGATGQVGWIDDYLFDEEFVLLGEDGAPFLDPMKNKAYLIRGKSWVNNHAHILRAMVGVMLNPFLCNYLNIVDYSGYITGTTRYKLNQSRIRKISIPLPPLPEQRAIVTKIEQLFSDLDNGIANLKNAQEQLKIYRQAVLKKAFEGELTRKWRAEQTDLPSAEELLLQIKEEREKHYQKQQDEWKKAVKEWEDKGKAGKKPSRPKKPKELPPLSEGALKELPELPEVWKWDILGNITINITDGDHQPPPKSKSGIPFITISNIKSNKIDFSNTFFVNQEYYDSLIEYRKPRREDILYTVTGSFGIPVLIDFNKTFCFQRHIGLVRPYSQINNKWLFWLLQVNFIYKQAQKTATGTAQKTVALSSLRKFMIPLSSLQEQHQIVKEIETRLSVCDKLEETIAEALQKSEALRQSILKKAFVGELLNEKELEEARNAPDWEPAEKLLERIKTEKEKTGNKKSF